MTIMNRRNAVVGFLTLKVGKMMARRKAKQVTGRFVNRKKNEKNEKSDQKND